MRAFLVLPLLGLGLITVAGLASAHEHVCVKGAAAVLQPEGGTCGPDQDLHFVVGWRVEPPFTMLKNGLDLAVRDPHANNTPIDNVTTLKAQYEFGGKTFPLALEGQFGKPGYYSGDITPTRPGQYTVRVTGSVRGMAVNFTVDPAEVGDAHDIEFPEKTADASALSQQVKDLQTRVAALETKMATMKTGDVSGEPASTGGAKGAPGFEVVAALGAVGIALLWRRRGA